MQPVRIGDTDSRSVRGVTPSPAASKMRSASDDFTEFHFSSGTSFLLVSDPLVGKTRGSKTWNASITPLGDSTASVQAFPNIRFLHYQVFHAATVARRNRESESVIPRGSDYRRACHVHFAVDQHHNLGANQSVGSLHPAATDTSRTWYADQSSFQNLSASIAGHGQTRPPAYRRTDNEASSDSFVWLSPATSSPKYQARSLLTKTLPTTRPITTVLNASTPHAKNKQFA